MCKAAHCVSLIALAEAAVTYDLVRPTMKEEPVLSIKNGRHILHELKSSPYIPNDTLMSGGYGGRFASMVSLGIPRSGISAMESVRIVDL